MSAPGAVIVGQKDEGRRRRGFVQETARAVKNAFILGASMLASWSVAVVMWVLLPRLLGPSAYGTLHFADYFAMGFFAFTTLGVDTYIRKEIATRPDHASDFMGGVLVLRFFLGVLLIGGMWVVLTLSGREGLARDLVVLFGGGYLLQQLNLTFASLLQAKGEVTGLARMNVVAKFVWGGGIAIGLALKLPLLVVPASLILAEGLKSGVLFWLVRRHLQLRLDPRVRATATVLLASVPFYLTALARTIYDKIDVTMIGLMMTDAEAGWYGAATRVTMVPKLLVPLVLAVVLPTASRAAEVSADELRSFMSNSMKLVLTFAVPAALLLGLGADLWAVLIFGAEYAPAVGALQLLAATFVFTYVATLSSVHLFQLEKQWLVTGISVAAMLVNPAINLFSIPAFGSALGDGGAGTGAAAASLASEFLVVILMVLAIGFTDAVRPLGSFLLRTLAVAIAVLVVHQLAVDLGRWRLLVDGTVYVALAFAFRAVTVRDLRMFFNLLRSRRGNP